MSYVFVLDRERKPLNPCHPAVARMLLKKGKAAVIKRYPFIIILRKHEHSNVQLLRLKIDPGSKVTGLALVNDATGKVLMAAEINHRGAYVHKRMIARIANRRSRRARKTRYRQSRFDNRKKQTGMLPPSLESRVANIITWVTRMTRYSPISALSLELVRFDMQLIQNPEIDGIQYQQGTLAGYELREYLLQKFRRTCVYCKKQDIPLEMEHIVPKTRGGSNRVSNLDFACRSCNQLKGNQTAAEFGYPEVQQQAQKPLKDAAAVNITRWKIYNSLLRLGLPVETGTGGRTKFNRTELNLPKAHWLDAACVGLSTPENLDVSKVKPLMIIATGHGSRQMCKVDAFGFPRTKAKEAKKFFGFQTGDIVHAVVTKGKKIGRYVGKAAVRASGFFNIVTYDQIIQNINHKYCKRIHAYDGYNYNFITSASTAP